MNKLSISIMHCSWNIDRQKMLELILSRLNKSLLTNLTICDDLEKKGIWWNCKNAWNNISDLSTHHLVLQDDMLPCQNFIETLYQIISIKPEEIIHIFACNPAAISTLEQHKHWHTIPEGTWGGAVILPRKYFDWYKWVDKYFLDFHIHCDDTRMDHYLVGNQLKAWCVVPGLIEHIGYDKSLIGNSKGTWRLSRKYMEDIDPLTIDWQLGADDPIIGDPTWGDAYDDFHQHLKFEYRRQFMEKLGYRNKLSFPFNQ